MEELRGTFDQCKCCDSGNAENQTSYQGLQDHFQTVRDHLQFLQQHDQTLQALYQAVLNSQHGRLDQQLQLDWDSYHRALRNHHQMLENHHQMLENHLRMLENHQHK